MELTSRMKMERFQTFWIQMRKNKPLDESHKVGQNSGRKKAFYSNYNVQKREGKIITYKVKALRDFKRIKV
ncbi:hypothetical protein Hanom_Chr06g00568631 [Helianthus anomalus]